jgi:hypothetical protein
MTARVAKAITVVLLVASWGCVRAPAIRSTAAGPLSPAELSAFWQDVDPRSRDLLHGVGGKQVRPEPEAVFEAIGKDTGGFSVSYDVRDPSGVEWSVKVGEEAQSEVTSSRLVWAMGYHQPPVTYLPRWRVREGDQDAVRTVDGGRFRPKLPTFDNADIWSWYQNPFVDTQAYRGLLVLMMILNSTDLKDDNNALYERRDGERLVARWYVVKDLGATLGTTGRLYPKRNDIGEFERHEFIDEVDDGRVRFAYRGRHQQLLKNIRPADVVWMCERLQRLTDEQWRDAFRAGGYDEATTARYIRVFERKIAEGLALGKRTSRGASQP